MLEFARTLLRGKDSVRRDRDDNGWSEHAACRPDLLPPLELMQREHISVLEDWFAWAVQWEMTLRTYGGFKNKSTVLEIGCGLGRIAYMLRDYLAIGGGQYHGFDICNYKIQF